MVNIRVITPGDVGYDVGKLADLLSKEIPSRQLLIIFCNCSIEYQGRSRSVLPEGDRIVIVKTNHSVIIHRPEGYSPVNWQPDSSKISFRVEERDGAKKLLMISIRESPREYLWIWMNKVYSIVVAEGMEDRAHFSMYVSENEVKDILERHPEIIEEGLEILSREYRTRVGIIDFIARDRLGRLVAIEVKDEKASMDAAKQLHRYVKQLEKEAGNVRGILVAPSLTTKASEYLERYGLEKVLYDPQKFMEIYLNEVRKERYHGFARKERKLTEFFQ